MNDDDDKLDRTQSKFVTNTIFVALGALTIAFWGVVIWLGVAAFTG